MLAGFQLIIVAQAASIESTRSFERMAELIPAFLQRGMGGRAMLLASFKGTVTFGYFHPVIAIMVSVLAIYMASEPAYDVESGLVDLVLARSIPRHRLMTRSLLLFTAVTLAAGLCMAFGTWIGLHTFASPASNWPTSTDCRSAAGAPGVGRLVLRRAGAGSGGWCAPLERRVRVRDARRRGAVPDRGAGNRLGAGADRRLDLSLSLLSGAADRGW